MIPIRGPRIYVKRDEESRIGRGCQLHAAHFRPEISEMTRQITLAAWAVFGHECEILLTEGFRDIRESRDLHEELRALDYTITVRDSRATIAQYERVMEIARTQLGRDYDMPPADHGSAPHIHCEYDPK